MLFLGSWTAAFISTSAAFLMLLTLSASVHETTGSVLWSSSVFASQWVLALVAPPLVAWLTARKSTVRLLIGAELGSAAIALLIALTVNAPLIFVLLLLSLRGVMEAVNKSLRFLPLKVHLPPQSVKPAVGYLATAQYLATGAGSILGIALVQIMAVEWICAVSAALFLISSALYLCIQRFDVEETKQPVPIRAQLHGVVNRVQKDISLARSALILVACVVLYQSLHNIARAEYPSTYLGMGVDGTMWVQLISSVAILAGAIYGSRYLVKRPAFPSGLWFLLLTMLTSLAIFISGEPIVGLMLYGIFILFFELTFVVAQADVIERTPANELAVFNSALNSSMTFLMAIVIVAGGLFADLTSLFWTAISFFIAGLAGVAFTFKLTPVEEELK